MFNELRFDIAVCLNNVGKNRRYSKTKSQSFELGNIFAPNEGISCTLKK